MRFLTILFLCLAAFWGQGSVAQSVPDPVTPVARETIELPDYDRWSSVANRAEAAVDARADANSVFESLRGRIAGFREQFSAARLINAERISTLRDQITAIGPAPAEGETEDPEIAERRKELNTQLQTLLAPVQAAEEAFTRADGLIREIDTIIRERQAQRLLTLGSSPVNPVHWPVAVRDLGNALSEIGDERRVFRDQLLLDQARANLPVVLTLLAMAVVLLSRGRSWAHSLGEYMRRFGGRGSGVWSFVVSLLRVLLPLGGVFALTGAVFASGLVGLRGTAILQALPVWAGLLLGLRWLAERLFAREDDDAILNFGPERRSEARFYITSISLLLVLRGILGLFFDFSDFADASKAVLLFPIVLVLGLILFRLGAILRGYMPPETEDDEAAPSRGLGVARIIRTLGFASIVISVVSPVMAAIGYEAVSTALLYPAFFTLAILGTVMVLQRFVADIYGWVSGQGDQARDSLFVVLVNFALVLSSTPFLALIWGARVADLSELWGAFRRGFQVGDTTISPTDFITFAVIFAAGYILTRILQTTLRGSVLPKTRIDIGAQNALISGVGYVGIFLAAVVSITAAGIDLSNLALVAGALSVGIGFGLQNIVSNFVSGIILLIERPISEGDWIEVGGQHGYVRNISVRSTRIETFDRSDVIVPNSDLVSGTVTNYTRGNTVGRVIVPVGVAYGTDTRKVEQILREVAEAHPMVVSKPGPSVVFQNFGASSLDFEIRAILRDVNWMLSVKSEMNHQIAQRFSEEGIEIPFPQQDLWLRNPEALRTPQAPLAQSDNRGNPDDTAEGEQGDAQT